MSRLSDLALQALLKDLEDVERDNAAIRLKLQELEHAHDTLLELHGESMARCEELQLENETIRTLCREQTLLLAETLADATTA